VAGAPRRRGPGLVAVGIDRLIMKVGAEREDAESAEFVTQAEA
jgi:hypothetical protein